jgi:hypothetical protein
MRNGRRGSSCLATEHHLGDKEFDDEHPISFLRNLV